MLASLTVMGLFLSLAWVQQYWLNRLLEADLQRFRRSRPNKFP